MSVSSPHRVPDDVFDGMQEVSVATFAPPLHRTRGVDRTALSVKITLGIVVTLLLFSVIALPKLRGSADRHVPAAVSKTAR